MLGRRLAPLLALSCCTALAAAGCQREEPIRHYTIPKERATASAGAAGTSPHGPASATPAVDAAHAMPTVPAGPQRMLAAIVPHEETAWFFKVVGPKDAMAAQAAPFRRLVESIRFAGAGAPPTWTLPEGYAQQQGSGMRFATIQVAGPEGPLDLSVTALRIAGELNEYVLMNVDRWRQQLGLEPTTADRLFDPSKRSGELTEVATKGGGKAYLVDLTGEGTGAMPAAPLAGAGRPPMAGAGTGGGLIPGLPGGAAPAAPGLSYRAPAGWAEGQAGGMRRAAFTVKDGDRAAEMTVIALAAGSGDLLSNVNRWREQVGLGPVDVAGLKAIVTDVPIAGGTGQRVELVGPAEARPREAILGVIAERGDQVWFLKLKGDAALVEQQRGPFDEFVRSLSFDGRNGGDHGQ